jgi:putative transposase
MLFQNDIYVDANEQRYRVLNVDTTYDQAWVIAIEEKHAWPEPRSWSAISWKPVATSQVDEKAELSFHVSSTQQHRAARALGAIQPLLNAIPEVYVPANRAQLVKAHAAASGISERTLRNYLREYWQGGQTPSALHGGWHRCGRVTGALGKTARRGRRPIHGEYAIFEVDDSAKAKLEEAAVWYLKDGRRTIAGAYQFLLRAHYARPDGNGELHVNLKGERPTLRQFDYYLRKRYSTEVRLRYRLGDKDFERDHRAKLGSARFDCQGVGDIYEIDATIADIFLVAKNDRTRIIGKPTVYIIIDRRSGLITGFYVGLENASWTAARLAILTVAADKAELCRRHGVVYDPEDWPAHSIMPRQFYADRGEMISRASSRIVEGLNLTVTNIPGMRPDWKPFVECGFKLMHQALAEHAPGFDPASNFTKRRGKHYEKDASLTLDDFSKIMLEHVIAHNRRPKLELELSNAELMEEVIPAPIDLWNFDVQTRSGYLSRVREMDVKFGLLPTDKAVVTEEGIHFKNCYYTCEEAIQKGWFIQGRKKRFAMTVSYDPRLADAIYIHDESTRGKYIRADMTDVSRRRYSGLSFSEVHLYKSLEKKTLFEAEQIRQQIGLEYVQRITPTIEDAKASLKRAPKKSRTSRKADIKDDREQALREERANSSAPLPRVTKAPSHIIQKPELREVSKMPSEKQSLAQLVADQRAKMLKG